MTILEFDQCSRCHKRICKSPVTGNWFHWDSGDTYDCCKYPLPDGTDTISEEIAAREQANRNVN